jgi:hypothetical protein
VSNEVIARRGDAKTQLTGKIGCPQLFRMLNYTEKEIKKTMFSCFQITGNETFHSEIIEERLTTFDILPEVPTCLKFQVKGRTSPCKLKFTYATNSNDIIVYTSLEHKIPSEDGYKYRQMRPSVFIHATKMATSDSKYDVTYFVEPYLYVTIMSASGIQVSVKAKCGPSDCSLVNQKKFDSLACDPTVHQPTAVANDPDAVKAAKEAVEEAERDEDRRALKMYWRTKQRAFETGEKSPERRKADRKNFEKNVFYNSKVREL